MLQIEREIVQRENTYATNEIENRRLEQLHTQLNSFNLQATLIVGFALSTLNADNLVAISDDSSKFCMYKQPIVAALYSVLTIFSIGTSMTCLGLSFYIIVRSQSTANEVSVTHTVALVRRLQSHIVTHYMVGMLAFFASLLLLLWMYIGQPNWIPLPGEVGSDGSTTRWATGTSAHSKTCPTSVSGFTGNPACDTYMANGWDTPVVTTDAGETLATCLNPFNATHQSFQRAVGMTIASAATVTFGVVGVIGLWSYLRVRRAFRDMTQLPEVKHLAAVEPGGACRKPEFIQMLQTPGGSQRGAGASARSAGAEGSAS